MDEIDKSILRTMQNGIPLIREPFKKAAKEIGISQEETISRLKTLMRKGIIRRFGASINHRKIGIVANALVAWKVPQNRIEEIGQLMSGYEEITHCYERKVIPKKWEYNLFTVIHGYNRKSVEGFIKKLSELTGLKDNVIMFSTKQFKRSSIPLPESVPIKE